jgi:hypothetical protein
MNTLSFLSQTNFFMQYERPYNDYSSRNADVGGANSRLSNTDMVTSDILEQTIETSLSLRLNLYINAISSQNSLSTI